MDGETTRTSAATAAATGVTSGALVAGLLLVLAPGLLQDPDTLWHVASGLEIITSGRLPVQDSWSWTFAGEPWIAKEWLAQVLLAAAHRGGSWPLVVVLAVAAIATAFGLLARFVRHRLPLVATAALLAATFVLSAPHLLARPHVLALPLLVLWTAGLVAAVDEGRPPPWPLLAVFVVWVNLHGSFLVGAAVAAALALEAVLRAGPGARPATGRRWAGFAALTAIATLATPYGAGVVAAALDVLALGDARSVIVEWRRPGPAGLATLLVVVLGGVLMAVRHGVRLHWARIVLLAALVVLALGAVRNAAVLGFVAPLLVAGPVGAALADRRAPTAPPRGAARGPALAVLAAVLGLAGWTALGREVGPPARTTPTAAVDALVGSGATRVFNQYDVGGYLILRGVPTFIDGRAELFGGPFVLAHDAAVRLDPPGALEALLAEHDVDATLLEPGAPAVSALDATAAWVRVHEDAVAVVHVRSGPPSAP